MEDSLIFYVISNDGDDVQMPNCFVARHSRGVPLTLKEVKEQFPIPGKYHFRLRVDSRKFLQDHQRQQHAKHVWLDVHDEKKALPQGETPLFLKAVRICWNGDNSLIKGASLPSGSLPRAVPGDSRNGTCPGLSTSQDWTHQQLPRQNKQRVESSAVGPGIPGDILFFDDAPARASPARTLGNIVVLGVDKVQLLSGVFSASHSMRILLFLPKGQHLSLCAGSEPKAHYNDIDLIM